jgi:hypothetical protein
MNDSFFCNICSKNFKTKYTLKVHQNTSKKCLKLQNKEEELPFVCEDCKKIFSSKYNLDNHLSVCKQSDKNKVNNLEKKINTYVKKIQELKEQIKDLEQFKIYKVLYEEEKNKNSKLEEDYKTLASKAIENSGNKTTNNIVNNKNRIIQSLLPLTDEYMKDQVKFLTYNNVKDGIEGMAHFASKYTFKDRLYCSDVSRLNFIFKNENGVTIKDPEGVEITKRFIEINKEELLRLLDEYYNFILEQLDNDLDIIEYRHWTTRREEIIATRSAVKRGNISENTESYTNFKKSFLSALSELVAR